MGEQILAALSGLYGGLRDRWGRPLPVGFSGRPVYDPTKRSYTSSSISTSKVTPNGISRIENRQLGPNLEYDPTRQGSFFFDPQGNFDYGNALGLGLGLAQFGSMVFNPIMAYQAYKRGVDQANFERAVTQANFRNAVKVANNKYDSAYNTAAGLAGGTMDSTGLASQASPTLVAEYQNKAKEKHLSDTIG